MLYYHRFVQKAGNWMCPPRDETQESMESYVERKFISKFLPIPLLAVFVRDSISLAQTPSNLLPAYLLLLASAAVFLCIAIREIHFMRHKNGLFIAILTGTILSYIVLFLIYNPDKTYWRVEQSTIFTLSLLLDGLYINRVSIWIFAVANSIFSASLNLIYFHNPFPLQILFSIIPIFAITWVIQTYYHSLYTSVYEGEYYLKMHNSLAIQNTKIETLNATLQTESKKNAQTFNQLELIFNSSSDIMYFYNTDGEIILVNKQGLDFAEKLTNPQLNKIQFTIFTQEGERIESDQNRSRILAHVMEDGQTQKIRLVAWDKKIYILESTAKKFIDPDGNCIGYLEIVQDKTADYKNSEKNNILQTVARLCNHAADIESVAQMALTGAAQGIHFSLGAILIAEDDNPEKLRLLSSYAANDQVKKIFKTIEQNVTNHIGYMKLMPQLIQCFQSNTPVFNFPVNDTELFHNSEYTDYALSFLPLQFNKETFGLFGFMYRAKSLTDPLLTDTEFLLTITEEIATSLHRALLFENAQKMALFDSATGLRNYRSLQDVLHSEISISSTNGLPLALLILDIDHFRHFNEEFGHDSGDMVLRFIAKILGTNGTAARYGGDEIAIILPASNLEESIEFAEKLQIDIHAQLLEIFAGTEDLLSLTIGLAMYPLHASAPGSLMKAAELALFAAKRKGRRCVVAFNHDLLQEQTKSFIPRIIASTDSFDFGDLSLPTGNELETVQSLVTAVDLRDGYTASHSENVSRYAVAIAKEIRLSYEEIEILRLGGLVHDVGKIGVSDEILRKPGKLTKDEWNIMQAHTTMGEAILAPLHQMRVFIPLTRWHHERLDGSGYPDGLKGDEIPMLVRILSVADVFDAYTAERPYHPGRSALDGITFLRKEANSNRLDTKYVEALAQILEEERYVVHTDDIRQDEAA